MMRTEIIRALFSLLVIVLGNLQAWDSDVHEAGLGIVLLVSLAIALTAVALLLPLQQSFLVSVFVFSFILLVAARLTSPIPLPGLFLVLVPAVPGLIFNGVFADARER